jgi:hypothetical protein
MQSEFTEEIAEVAPKFAQLEGSALLKPDQCDITTQAGGDKEIHPDDELTSPDDRPEISDASTGNPERRSNFEDPVKPQEERINQGDKRICSPPGRGEDFDGRIVDDRVNKNPGSGHHTLGQRLEGNPLQDLGVYQMATTSQTSLNHQEGSEWNPSWESQTPDENSDQTTSLHENQGETISSRETQPRSPMRSSE